MVTEPETLEILRSTHPTNLDPAIQPLILAVDDVHHNRVLIEVTLTRRGYRVITANEGFSALEIALEQVPDLILMDVMMPGQDGYECCTLLKANPITAGIPVIFLSALGSSGDRVKGLQAGGVDFITKPFAREELLERVRVHLKLSGAHDTAARQQKARLQQLRSAQLAILSQPEDLPAAAFSVFYRPVHEAGGDFYDVFPMGRDVFGYFVADISGHGIGASFLTPALKAAIRNRKELDSAQDTLRSLDSVMRQILNDEAYLTACCASLNHATGQLTVVSAGHPPVIVVHREDRQVTVIDMDTDVLGMFVSVVLHEKTLTLAQGDRVFMYTDGMTELVPGANRKQGLEALIEACVEAHSVPISQAAGSVSARVRGTGSDDDLLLMAIEVTA